ncbi:HAUS8 isoform 4 [Pan troglodytes]|uniref:HAUS augmin like complex subunit 8 n=2 Tax=Homininae TaxID=207598 RepID=M0R1H1_HUMAN|nr:HAUS8 isoform 4 [Pan troglodytes]
MADSSGRGAGKPATGPTNSSSAKKKDKRVQVCPHRWKSD